MVMMAALVKLPLRVVAFIGLAIIVGHNLLTGYAGEVTEGLTNDVPSILWKLFYVGFFAPPIEAGPDGPRLIVLYTIIPWVGVMAAGYAFGAIVTRPPAQRDRACLTIGLGAIALVLVLRGFNLYGDRIGSTLWRASVQRCRYGRIPLGRVIPVLRLVQKQGF
jgi:uncharacterized membrane protein